MHAKQDELKALFNSGRQNSCAAYAECYGILERRKLLAQMYAENENGIAVLSDLQNETSYIYSGKLGEFMGLANFIEEPSIFEEKIFNYIPSEELMERHILELRFIQLQKKLPPNERPFYNMICLLHFSSGLQSSIPILHRTYYIENLPDGNIWLSLCLYTPFIDNTTGSAIRGIIDNRTGKAILSDTYNSLDNQLLSAREINVLSLLAKGLSSKQIADTLCISVNTVYRHRQNILSALQVNNTAAAVEIAVRLHLIS